MDAGRGVAVALAEHAVLRGLHAHHLLVAGDQFEQSRHVPRDGQAGLRLDRREVEDDLLQGGVARAFADAPRDHVDPVGAGRHRGHGVAQGVAGVAVAVPVHLHVRHAQRVEFVADEADDAVGAQRADDPDGVGEGDDVGAALDLGAGDRPQVLGRGLGGVLGARDDGDPHLHGLLDERLHPVQDEVQPPALDEASRRRAAHEDDGLQRGVDLLALDGPPEGLLGAHGEHGRHDAGQFVPHPCQQLLHPRVDPVRVAGVDPDRRVPDAEGVEQVQVPHHVVDPRVSRYALEAVAQALRQDVGPGDLGGEGLAGHARRQRRQRARVPVPVEVDGDVEGVDVVRGAVRVSVCVLLHGLSVSEDLLPSTTRRKAVSGVSP